MLDIKNHDNEKDACTLIDDAISGASNVIKKELKRL
jgi:hypothetical protein